MPQPLPSHWWKSIRPSVVSAVKSGAMSPKRKAMVNLFFPAKSGNPKIVGGTAANKRFLGTCRFASFGAGGARMHRVVGFKCFFEENGGKLVVSGGKRIELRCSGC